ncbi:GSCOCG00001392001-RA-CDS [Cotesia congregata]|nr:GSCOCG00001392001-RA-CDS [Cotesia congregata]
MTINPKALARKATADPILPNPTIPRVQNKTKCRIGNFFDSIPGDITNSNAQLTSSFYINVVNS